MSKTRSSIKATAKAVVNGNRKGKKIHNRFDGSQIGSFGGYTIYRRLSVGLPKDLDDFLTAQSYALKTCKAEIIRRLLRRESHVWLLRRDVREFCQIRAMSEEKHVS